MFELTGYAAIVTGGARGIGRAIALALADAGADVLFTYKGNTTAADAVVAEINAKGRTAVAVQADAADPDSAVAVVAKAMESARLSLFAKSLMALAWSELFQFTPR